MNTIISWHLLALSQHWCRKIYNFRRNKILRRCCQWSNGYGKVRQRFTVCLNWTRHANGLQLCLPYHGRNVRRSTDVFLTASTQRRNDIYYLEVAGGTGDLLERYRDTRDTFQIFIAEVTDADIEIPSALFDWWSSLIALLQRAGACLLFQRRQSCFNTLLVQKQRANPPSAWQLYLSFQ